MDTTTNSASKPKALERPEKWAQLANAISLRSSQDQVMWNIFGVFWGANAILLVALFTTGKMPEEPVGIVVSIVGTALSVVWHIMQNRACGHLERFEALMSKMEKSLEIDPNETVSQKINVADYTEYVGKKVGFGRKLIKRCSLVGAILWFAGLGYFILKSIHLI
ncbi:MAG: hypothetical protein KKI12_09105 [Proteobacteria bacterium]|nr:hypothetical protein [Pseudomonadota bacterium]MBU4288313.1 hypothetical protein [Pseudomonadota bacterium]MCG2713938.1 hypothetical protein [Candidatus Omnitrophota bacterium]